MSFPDEFRQKFDTALRTGKEALEDAGYTFENYKAFLENQDGVDYHHFSEEDPLDALDQTVEEIGDQGRIPVYINGSQLEDVMNGELDSDKLIYQHIRGGIDPEDPMVQIDDHRQPDELPGFVTSVQYIPDFPEDRFKITNHITRQPYTQEDTKDRVEDMKTALEDAGLEAEIGFYQ